MRSANNAYMKEEIKDMELEILIVILINYFIKFNFLLNN